MDIKTFESDLEQFIGTEHWYQWSVLFPRFVLTDGAKFLADEAKAYWLMDLIASYQINLLVVQGEYFQAWVLEVQDHGAVATCTDGNGNLLARQVIEYTDFPLAQVELWAVYDTDYLRIMLPGEY